MRKESPLNHIKIASPCSADWASMFGNDRRRFCGDCKLNVYNISGMTLSEAEELLERSEGRLCVRYYRRADGTILTKDCPVGLARLKQKVSRLVTAAFSLIVGLFSGLFLMSYFSKEARPRGIFTIDLIDRRPDIAVMGVAAISNSNSRSKPEMGEFMGNVAIPITRTKSTNY